MNGEPEYKMTLSELLKRRDALNTQTVFNPEEYAWDWIRLAADFDSLGFSLNAERCRGKAEHYFDVQVSA